MLTLHRHPRRRGFTYIELTIVVTIIAILAAIAVPNFLEAQTRARVARTKADLAVLAVALEDYRLDRRAYPPNAQTGVGSSEDLWRLTTPVAYLTRLPLDAMTVMESPRGGPPLSPPRPYHYYHALAVAPEVGLRIESTPCPSDAEGFLAGLLWGYGPVHPNWGAEPPRYTTIRPDATADLTAYDPSNGTTSAGDIYRPLP